MDFVNFWTFMHPDSDKQYWEIAKNLYYRMVVYHVLSLSLDNSQAINTQIERIFLRGDPCWFLEECKTMSAEFPLDKHSNCLFFLHRQNSSMGAVCLFASTNI
jgi:hypothetical protein